MNSKWQLKYLVPKLVDKLIVYGDAYSRFMTQILQPLTWVNYTQFYDSVALATDLSHISISTLVSHPVLTSSLSVLLSFIETEGRRGESISTLVSHPVLISSLSVLLSFIETEGRRREFFGCVKRPQVCWSRLWGSAETSGLVGHFPLILTLFTAGLK